MDYTQQFAELDTDHNGLINYDDFLNVFKEGSDNNNKHFKIMFDIADIEENGSLNVNEFVRLMTTIKGIDNDSDRSVYSAIFHLLDEDNSGNLELNELVRFMKAVKVEIGEEELKNAMGDMDADKDGKVGCEDLLKYLLD
ncbi:calcium-binding protein, putative [Entamoeba invadens IP1]|uniref:Calcium-binding protein, putative n=1 Tax=Entamoeba invadens IP1 TaxID=370355 RepID=A0A0A1UDI8_ENTIV|nr:calcium-binding protein, putative [Entamoeba invadens IP1]ELP94390.1 calcium-binding protein, putative [Entamoeba invadens IP1]|eukprot:XP_004261161.1 calcium-binding protein, putative [Entamoeba invadens IP1]